MANFLKNLFTPKWQHSDQAVRLDAINDQLSQDTLTSIITDDSSVEVRIKAIGLIKDAAFLNSLQQNKDQSIKASAFKQFCQITLNSSDENEQIQAISNITDNYLLMQLASQSLNAQISLAALQQLANEEELFNFIMQCESAKSRLLALEKIQSKDKLKTIEKTFKNKDKSLVRLAKNKLQDLEVQQQATQETQDKIAALVQQVVQLSEQAFNPEYLAKFTYLKQQWEKTEASEQQKTQFQNALNVCQSLIEENQQLIETQNKQNQAKEKAQSIRKRLFDDLEALFKDCKGGACNQASFVNELNEKLARFDEQWMVASELFPADKTSLNDFKNLINPIKNLLKSLEHIKQDSLKELDESLSLNKLKQLQKQLKDQLKAINWPEEFPAHANITKIHESIDNIQKQLDQLHNQQQSISHDVASQLEKLEQEIKAGHLKPAKSLQQKIRKNIEQLEHQKGKDLNARFQSLCADLNELNDWQGFAAAPKFEALCQEMAALIDADLENKVRAESIKSLQQQWKQLGSLPDKKQHNELWAKFKAAADEAYKPCQAYYDELSKVRAFNKEQRELICSQLELFFEQYDWSNSDWKVVQQLLDKAHHEYKNFAPVDKAVNKGLLNRFNQAIKQIQGKLSEHYQSNIDAKTALIDACKTLLESDDLANSTQQCKQHQQDWKAIGNAGRKEHALWAEFRSVCDAIFERRSQAYNAQKQENNQRQKEADNLIDAAKILLTLPAEQALKEISDFEEKIIELDLAPKTQQNKLHKLNDIKKALEANKATAQQAAKNQLWQNALELSKQLAQAEQQADYDPQSAVELVAKQDVPTELETAFKQRIANPNSQNSHQDLCLELEIAMGLPSPSEEQALRMSKQVELLQQNMGKQTADRQSTLQNLIRSWCAMPSTSQDYTTYEQRFYTGLDAAMQAG